MTQRAAASSSAHRVPHRVTVRKTAYQVQRLQEMWALTHTPTKEQREQIADEIGLETRIVSTWFRDERSKLTRANAEKQRIERGTVGPVRNTRTSTATRFKSEADAEDDEDDEEALDRHPYQPPHSIPQPQTRASPSTRYAPYPVSNSIDNVDSNGVHVKKLPQRHFDPLIRASVPIDFQHAGHNSQLSMETDTDSYGYPSPNAYHQRSSLPPAPSISSSETSEDEDELAEDEEGMMPTRVEMPRDFSPRTPGLLPSTIPSPRVVHPSTSPTTLPPISTFVTNPDLRSSPLIHNDVFLAPPSKGFGPKSPFNAPITLPTQSGGTYTFQPLPVIIGQLPKRDSAWRFGEYGLVSSMRQTLGGKLRHSESRMDDSESSDEDEGIEDGLLVGGSPAVRPTEPRGGVLSGLGGFLGKKQLFVSPTSRAA